MLQGASCSARRIATRAPHDVRYHPRFNGRPGVVFALRDDCGRVVGAHADPESH